MRRLKKFGFGLLFLLQGFAGSLWAQSWEFVKEEDGVQIFTRQEPGKSLKEFKGIADIQAPVEKVFTVVEDVNHTGWWDENLIGIKVLAYEKNKGAKYYMIYDAPWPVSNRDLYAEVTVAIDQAKRVYTITSFALTTGVPGEGDLVRIRDYRQKWTITPTGENSTHVILEGFIDPAGKIPVWVSNRLIIQSPVNTIIGLKEQLKKK